MSDIGKQEKIAGQLYYLRDKKRGRFEIAFRRARAAAERAHKAEIAARRRADDFAITRAQQTERLYQSVIGQKVRIKALEDVRGKIMLLAERQAALESAHADAQRVREEKDAEQQAALEDLRRAEKALDKAGHLRSETEAEAARLAERAEEAELDELAASRSVH